MQNKESISRLFKSIWKESLQFRNEYVDLSRDSNTFANLLVNLVFEEGWAILDRGDINLMI